MADRSRHVSPWFVLVALGVAVTLVGGGQAAAAEAPVGLGTATSFAVIGGTTVTNTGPTTVSGDLGVSPGAAVTGFPPGIVNEGAIHAADALAAQAQAAVVTAYDDAAGRTPFTTIAGDLAGRTLVSGVYRGGALGLSGTLTLDGQGDPNAVFVFQAASTLITGSSSRVALIGGAQACNVFWQVGSSATLGTGSTFVGTILALTAVSANTGATIAGRLFARNAAVTLDTNTITRPVCAAAAPGTTTTTSSTTTSTTSTTSTTLPVTTTSTPAVVVPATAPGSGSGTGTPGAGDSSTGLTTTGAPGLPRTGGGPLGLTLVAMIAIGSGGVLLAARRRMGTRA